MNILVIYFCFRKVNPYDCVDMDCDGMKEVLLIDVDGSFIDDPATVISQSEFEWNGDPKRGVGDHRIPHALLTGPIGNNLTVENVSQEKGVIFVCCLIVLLTSFLHYNNLEIK